MNVFWTVMTLDRDTKTLNDVYRCADAREADAMAKKLAVDNLMTFVVRGYIA